jgi:hypothetical protein
VVLVSPCAQLGRGTKTDCGSYEPPCKRGYQNRERESIGVIFPQMKNDRHSFLENDGYFKLSVF